MVDDERKRLGAWYTPPALVDRVVDAVVDPAFVAARGPELRVLDPACGDGRFLRAAVDRLRRAGAVRVEAIGVDVDPGAIEAARRAIPDATLVVGDALGSIWVDEPALRASVDGGVDLVVGNPPFLSQLASSTARGGASRHGGGPYADGAVEFLAVGSRLLDPEGGRLAFVLPQSLLSARDAAAVRGSIDRRASMIWSSWTGERDFDAQVVTCALAFEFGAPAAAGGIGVDGSSGGGHGDRWATVVTRRLGVPPVPAAMAVGAEVLGDRAWLNANFRDEYYGLVPAVDDHDDGPPLVTSGLIDPGVCHWGSRPVRFAKRSFAAPRVALDGLDARMRSWARRRLRPKVLVANQTRVLEAVADVDGAWLPGVPVVAVYPESSPGDAAPALASASAPAQDRSSAGPAGPVEDRRSVLEIAAVLTSAPASAWAWHERGGTGLSATAIRVGPVMLGELPWPTGPLDAAVDALTAGDVVACGRAVTEAYGVAADEAAVLADWWEPLVLSRTT